MKQLSELEIQKVKGYLASYYLALNNLYGIEKQISNCRNKLGIKAIRYDKESSSGGGISRDEQLLNMIAEIDELEIKKKEVLKPLARYHKVIVEKAKVTEEEERILDCLFLQNLSYEEIGKMQGYSKSQVYRNVAKIYEKIYTCIK